MLLRDYFNDIENLPAMRMLGISLLLGGIGVCAGAALVSVRLDGGATLELFGVSWGTPLFFMLTFCGSVMMGLSIVFNTRSLILTRKQRDRELS
ncbi:MAG: hypothetical protein GY835_06380 [bacterium]|nr:hypothetical protein [bacterium]